MTEPRLLLEITYEDLWLLDSESFDLVWSALGLIVRCRMPEPVAPPVIEPEYSDPDLTLDAEGITPPQARLVAALRAAARPVDEPFPGAQAAADAIDRAVGRSSADDVALEPFAAPVSPPSPPRVSVVRPKRGEPAECPGCHRTFAAGPGLASHTRTCRALHPGEATTVTARDIERADPLTEVEDERYFEAIRRLGKDASYTDVARDLHAKPGRIHQRLDARASDYTLPADIAVWRAHRSTQKGGGGDARIKDFQAKERDLIREAADEIKAREPEREAAANAEADDFAARRRANASAAADRAWAARTGTTS